MFSRFTLQSACFLAALSLTSSLSEAGDYTRVTPLSAGANVEDGSRFGEALAADGTWLMVGQGGTSDGGAVHFFRKSGSTWNFFQRLSVPVDANHPATSAFGRAMAIQGNTAVIGAPIAGPLVTEVVPNIRNGLVYVCDFDGTAWSIIQTLTPQFTSGADPQNFGRSLALDGDRLIVSGPQGFLNGRDLAGISHVFRRSGGVWTKPADPGFEILFAGPGGAGPGHGILFGNSTALKGEYALLSASAPATNTDNAGIYAFQDNTSAMPPFFEDTAGTGIYHPIRPEPLLNSAMTKQRFEAITMHTDASAFAARLVTDDVDFPVPAIQDFSIVELSRSGDVWSFGTRFPLSGFTRAAKITANEDGNTLLVSSAIDRRASLAGKIPGGWSEKEALPVPAGADDNFGNSSAISGTTLFVAASLDDTGGSDRGLVHVYELKPVLVTSGKKSFKTSRKKVTLKGSSRNVDKVEYQLGKGSFKRAKGRASAWKIPLKLSSGRNLVNVRATGPGGTTRTRYSIRLVPK